MKRAYIMVLFTMCLFVTGFAQATIAGRVQSEAGKKAVGFAVIYLKGTAHGCSANEEGDYQINAPAGKYTMIVSAVGYKTVEKEVMLLGDKPLKQDILLAPVVSGLDEVKVVGTGGVGRVKRSAFNAVAIDAKELYNTTKSLSDVLAKVPGIKLRESGGVGSDMHLMLDGFSGKYVKVFIDGVPQEGVGSSFGLNNIPVNFADHIEVYKGVVPVGFGTDALGGVINIVTNKKRRSWFLDASYSFGSFNTHRSYVNFGRTFANGLTYEINAFQNYSHNDYDIYAPVEDFETGRIDRKKMYKVRRFNDKYHNEAVVAKIGVTGIKWADRLMMGVVYSQMYKDIQTGVRQEIVYGQKHRKGYSLMPSLEYSKRNLLTRGLDLSLTANYNKNVLTNVDTASYKYNWLGEKKLLNSPGEQAYQYSRADNNNWNGTLNINYRLGQIHSFTFHHVLNVFHRSNTSLLAKEEVEDAIAKETQKNISGLSYRLMPSEKWNISVFAKHYNLDVGGPVPTTANADEYVRATRSLSSVGYGTAGTYFIAKGLQVKVSYEKAFRLPTIEELFGDEDLEKGDIGIRPESSHNVNLNLSCNRVFGKHSVYVEGGLIYRDANDYIQRNIAGMSGGKYIAAYVNYGKVRTKGYNLSARYGYGGWLSVGGNLTRMDVRDNMKTSVSGNAVNVAYKERMPNLPYLFADSDVTLTWRNAFRKGNTLALTYDNHYVHNFSYYSEVIGSNKGDYVVPGQFAHNISLSYALKNGRYNVSLECRNITDERLYDNFRLQKAGRAFYGKFRVNLGG